MNSVPRETADGRLLVLKRLILEEARNQNLIALSTQSDFDRRHLDDSLQLEPLVAPGPLLDIGSGAGLPGLVLACQRADPVILVEPRAKRAAFLRFATEQLGLFNVTILASRVETVSLMQPVATITARAVASLARIFAAGLHLANANTRWVLPKGRSAASELAEARASWQGRFSLIPSRTDPEAAIIVAEAVRRRSS